MLAIYAQQLNPLTVTMNTLFVIYGARLGGYLLKRELRSSSYNLLMAAEIKDGSDMVLPLKVAIWFVCALLYVCEVSPVLFRLENGAGIDAFGVIGAIVMVTGIALEAASDRQKQAAKVKNPKRFVDSGLFAIVRCPNYLGEILTWTGVFVSGFGVLVGPVQWIAAIFGWICIVYIMLGGARRLELRQNKNYGNDPEYQSYVKRVPIIFPNVPLYSVAKHKWLVG